MAFEVRGYRWLGMCLAFTWSAHCAAAAPVPMWGELSSGWVPVIASKAKVKKTVRKKPRQLQPIDRTPSGETLQARERRLLRECKGRPNAGACLGFAS